MGQTAAKMAMAGQLEVTPPELQFAVKVGEYSKRQMRLNNLGTQAIAFKIKTTNPKQYFVKPNQGVVQPKERAIIQVMMGKLPQLPADKCKDKFLVQTIPYEGNHTEGDKFDWKKEVSEKMPGAVVSECRLRCVFRLDDNKSEPASPAVGGGESQKPSEAPTIQRAAPQKQEMPTSAPKHTYSRYLIVAIMFFLVGRFTHHVEIPGL